MLALRRHTYGIYLSCQGLLLAGSIAVAALSSHARDWTPLALLILLVVLAALGEWFTLTIGSQNLSAGFIALVLAMTLLGPAPAVATGMVAIAVDSVHRRPPFGAWLKNFAAYATYLLLGGLFSRLLMGDTHAVANRHFIHSPGFALVVFGVFVVALLLNFFLVASHARIALGQSFGSLIRTQLVPMLPSQLAAAILAAILALAYTNLGYYALVAALVLILIFQYLTAALLRSEDRAEQLRARSLNLASLQLGVLVTLVETLALRDRAAARHAASVARYSRALAKEIGCTEEEQDIVHTSSLLHDIGKFALPDRILNAEVLSDDDWATIRRHPQDGATLVGRLDGYGPVSDIILYHHEQVDGSGYPAGLIGNEIPLLSRVLAVCNVYDTLTSRDSYRGSMTPQDAMAELRRVAGRSLDSELVQSFVTLVEREGPIAFTEGSDSDFESELAFERRARALAAPSVS
ncbi:MAG TPA: HD domain-containing phosphohydrolase [Solirubrobacteraceae bacterium]|jgi:putative nucleotidyltransferase with HDIG domain